MKTSKESSLPDLPEDFHSGMLIRRVTLGGNERLEFDSPNGSVPITSTEEFCASTVRAIAASGTTSFGNRVCECVRVSLVIPEGVIQRQFLCDGRALYECMTSVNEELLRAYMTRSDVGDVYAPLRLVGYLYRVARRQECFYDESGMMWPLRTAGCSLETLVSPFTVEPRRYGDWTPLATALIRYAEAFLNQVDFMLENLSGGKQVADELQSAGGKTVTLRQKSLRKVAFEIIHVVVTCRKEISKVLTCIVAANALEQEALEFALDEAEAARDYAACFVDDPGRWSSVLNLLARIPFAFHGDDSNMVTIAGGRNWDIAADKSEYGFKQFFSAASWEDGVAEMILSLLAVKCGGYDDEELLMHHDRLYAHIVEDETEIPEGLGLDADDVAQLREHLEELDSAGQLEPPVFPHREHLAGDVLCRYALPEKDRVDRIALEANQLPTIELVSSNSIRYRGDGKRVVFKVTDSELSMEGRDAVSVARAFAKALASVQIMGNGVGVGRSGDAPLKGSMVANLIFEGRFGTSVTLWLLSHILYGELRVSSLSGNSFAKALAYGDEGLRISQALHAEAVGSIHAATDGQRVYLCLNKTVILRIKRAGSSLKAAMTSVSVSGMQACTIRASRAVE